MNIIEKYSTTVVSIFQEIINNYEKDLDIIKQTEDELLDLYHEIELSAPKDMYRGYLMYKEIRDLRIKRRKAKEEAELLKEMYDYLKGQPAQNFKNKIQQIQGNAARIRGMQEHRTYTPRRREDLTIANHTSTEHKPFQEMLEEFNKIKISTQNGKFRK